MIMDIQGQIDSHGDYTGAVEVWAHGEDGHFCIVLKPEAARKLSNELASAIKRIDANSDKPSVRIEEAHRRYVHRDPAICPSC